MSLLRRSPSFAKRPVVLADFVYLPSFSVAVSDTTGDVTGHYEAAARINLYANGAIQALTGTSITPTVVNESAVWLLSGTANQYDVRVVDLVGDALHDPAAQPDIRYNLSTTRSYLLLAQSDGGPIAPLINKTTAFTMQILSNTTGAILTSNTFTLSAEAGSPV